MQGDSTVLVAPRVDELPPLAQRCIAAQWSTEASRAESKSTRLGSQIGPVLSSVSGRPSKGLSAFLLWPVAEDVVALDVVVALV